MKHFADPAEGSLYGSRCRSQTVRYFVESGTSFVAHSYHFPLPGGEFLKALPESLCFIAVSRDRGRLLQECVGYDIKKLW